MYESLTGCPGFDTAPFWERLKRREGVSESSSGLSSSWSGITGWRSSGTMWYAGRRSKTSARTPIGEPELDDLQPPDDLRATTVPQIDLERDTIRPHTFRQIQGSHSQLTAHLNAKGTGANSIQFADDGPLLFQIIDKAEGFSDEPGTEKPGNRIGVIRVGQVVFGLRMFDRHLSNIERYSCMRHERLNIINWNRPAERGSLFTGAIREWRENRGVAYNRNRRFPGSLRSLTSRKEGSHAANQRATSVLRRISR